MATLLVGCGASGPADVGTPSANGATANASDSAAAEARPAPESCEQGNGATCGHDAERILKSEGPKDPAYPIAQRGCELGDGRSCAIQGALTIEGIGVEKNVEAGIELVERGCQKDHPQACLILGAHAAKTNPTRMMEMFQRACSLGSGDGCYTLGRVYDGTENPVDQPAAVAAYSKGCNIQYGPACRELAQHMFDGQGIEKSPEKALAVLEKNCAAKELDSCVMLGTTYFNGKDVKQDREKAAAILKAACDAGSDLACRRGTVVNVLK